MQGQFNVLGLCYTPFRDNLSVRPFVTFTVYAEMTRRSFDKLSAESVVDGENFHFRAKRSHSAIR